MSLAITEELKDSIGMADTYVNLGSAFQQQEDYKSARDLFFKALNIYEKLGDKRGYAITCNNIGHQYEQEKDYKQSLAYHTKSIAAWRELDNSLYLGYSLNNIGVNLDRIGQSDSALINYNIALSIFQQIDSQEDVAWTYNLIGKLFQDKKDIKQAEPYLTKAYLLADELNLISTKKDISENLFHLYSKKADYKKALSFYIKHIQLKETLKNDETKKIMLTKQLTYQYEKQAAADSVITAEAKKVTDAQISAQKAQLKQEKTQRFTLYIGVFVLILFGAFMFNRFKVTKKQKLVIEAQKQEVEQQKSVVEIAHQELEEKNKEITDSIQYAKRIQNAILPPLKVVKEYLSESFILYKPKDIVAGDFYWLETISSRHSALDAESPNEQIAGQAHNDGSIVLFAAADCTGHGVPGAMVSVVCNNGLNRSVREYGLTDPAKILNKTREIVISEFEKSEDEVKDGMDIALCSLEGTTLKYAGANNPLWIIRKGEIIETKADKQPIGKFDELLPYTTHTFQLQKGDSIYIFSDGYVDQFGGEKGKKFKAAAFRTLLLSIQDKPMQEQQKVINTAFEDWRGNLEQIDDVCIIGVKI